MLIVTVDLDWAPEPAIERTLDFLQSRGVIPTIFATHRSPRVESSLGEIEVGLHPFFDPNSSHGASIEEVVDTVMAIPHNIPAFRCHRYASCNGSKEKMKEAGMWVSSNICTDRELLPPFYDRIGLIEVPIFLEDGGYLFNRYALDAKIPMEEEGLFVVTIHPMHFAINTPYFAYMREIKDRLSRKQWHQLTAQDLKEMEYKGRGIRDFLIDLIDRAGQTESMMRSLANSPKFSTAMTIGEEFRSKQMAKSSLGYSC